LPQDFTVGYSNSLPQTPLGSFSLKLQRLPARSAMP